MFSQSIYAASSVRKEILGALRILDDGRKFRYSRNGGVALGAGLPTIAANAVANHVSMATAANVAIGSTQVTVTLGATAATADQYAGGYLGIDEGAGLGTYYKIESHPAADASDPCLITLAEPIRVALTAAATKTTLCYNECDLVVVCTGVADQPVGVPLIAVPISYYHWEQTGGTHSAVLTSGTPALGIALSMGAGLLLAMNAVTDPCVGIVAQTPGRANEYTPVRLLLD